VMFQRAGGAFTAIAGGVMFQRAGGAFTAIAGGVMFQRAGGAFTAIAGGVMFQRLAERSRPLLVVVVGCIGVEDCWRRMLQS
jgi:hypothetical protein